MKIVVGLGNPGKQYLFTPHNLGWMVVDALGAHFGNSFQKKEVYDLQKIRLDDIDETLILIKPTIFMNRSGLAVKKALSYFDLHIQDVLVIHDEKDFPFLTMKFHKNKNDAGHNGIKDITRHLGTKDYARLRIGVKPAFRLNKHDGSPKNQGEERERVSWGAIPPAGFQSVHLPWKLGDPHLLEPIPNVQTINSFDVLKNFNKEEQKVLPQFLKIAVRAVKEYFEHGLNKTSSLYNSKTLVDYLKEE